MRFRIIDFLLICFYVCLGKIISDGALFSGHWFLIVNSFLRSLCYVVNSSIAVLFITVVRVIVVYTKLEVRALEK